MTTEEQVAGLRSWIAKGGYGCKSARPCGCFQHSTELLLGIIDALVAERDELKEEAELGGDSLRHSMNACAEQRQRIAALEAERDGLKARLEKFAGIATAKDTEIMELNATLGEMTNTPAGAIIAALRKDLREAVDIVKTYVTHCDVCEHGTCKAIRRLKLACPAK